MARPNGNAARRRVGALLPKTPTGIPGLDEITGGGLPTGRPTLICGSAGSGKTLLAVSFLTNGALQFDEPGVFMSFEESGEDIAANVASLGVDLPRLVARKKLALDFVRVERSEVEETGDYDLEGLFVRLKHAIDSVGATRVVLDTIEALFSGLGNATILRAELRRLFRWLKEQGVTAIITAERGEGTLTRQGLEEYVSDAVILLDHRIHDQISTRRLQIVKYRGSTHGTNEYPFLIDEHGISVLPITSLGLSYEASTRRISTGIERLDTMLGGKGYYRGSSVLVSGTAGTGKTSFAAHFIDAACRRGERCVYFLFEESPDQVVRNMRSIGMDLSPWIKQGRLVVHAARPTLFGLERHVATMHGAIEHVRPAIVVIDPVSSLLSVGTDREVTSALAQLIDSLKGRGVTALFTSLTEGGMAGGQSTVGISSLMDTWLLASNLEAGGERNRGLYILKSRGMAHSNQIREYLLTDRGIQFLDVYVGPSGVLTGATRVAQEAAELSAAVAGQQDMGRKERDLERRRKGLEAKIAEMRVQFATEAKEAGVTLDEERLRDQQLGEDRRTIAILRTADAAQRTRRARGRQ